MGLLILISAEEAPILKVSAALIAFTVGSAVPVFAPGLDTQAATVQKQNQSPRDVRHPPGDLFALSRPSPAEIRRSAAGHRLNSISRSACKVR
jgi:hypothetical protein